jgi:hypothetical protein
MLCGMFLNKHARTIRKYLNAAGGEFTATSADEWLGRVSPIIAEFIEISHPVDANLCKKIVSAK